MSRLFRLIAVLSCALALSTVSRAQSLSWSAYDISGNLVNANAGTGGDLIGGNTVSLTVPAGQTLIFVTQNFVPIDNSANSTTNVVTYNFSAQGLGAGNGLNGRPLGVGVFNTAGTGGVSDDSGYFTLWNPSGPYPEMYTHGTNNGANMFQGTQQGQGGTYNGLLQDFVTYAGAIRPRTSASGNISLGYGASLGAAGISWTDNASVTNTAYINAVAPPGGYKTFNEFAVYLSNTSGGDETINLDSITLTPVLVPEPSTIAFVGMGLLGLISCRRFRK
jgi:hypothetical protein